MDCWLPANSTKRTEKAAVVFFYIRIIFSCSQSLLIRDSNLMYSLVSLTDEGT